MTIMTLYIVVTIMNKNNNDGDEVGLVKEEAVVDNNEDIDGINMMDDLFLLLFSTLLV